MRGSGQDTKIPLGHACLCVAARRQVRQGDWIGLHRPFRNRWIIERVTSHETVRDQDGQCRAFRTFAQHAAATLDMVLHRGMADKRPICLANGGDAHNTLAC